MWDKMPANGHNFFSDSQQSSERLQKIFDYVYANVPFFQKRYQDAGLAPGSIRSLDDLKQIPFSNKLDLRDNYPLGLVATKPEKIVRLHASSGTKGKPTIVAYSQADIDLLAEVCARSLAACGVRAGDILQNSFGYGLFTGGLGLHYGAERLGATVLPASSGQSQKQVMLLRDLGARALACTPSYALNLVCTMDEMGIEPDMLNLEIGIFGAEPWSEKLREELQARLKVSAFDIYGLSEIIGPGVAIECTAKNGLHIWDDHFLPEIIDPKTQKVLPPGAEGELVLTSLTKQALPLIRYRTGDISCLLPEPCACGRTQVRMARINSRLDDLLIIRGVNLYPQEVARVLEQFKELSSHYQVIVDRQKALDTLEILVEVSAEHTNEELDALSHKAGSMVKDLLGLTAEITLVPPKSLPRSEGKTIRVIDRRVN
jgi:phenylacetate-CoA ligase